jgi:radical SAM family uncharacterized protein
VRAEAISPPAARSKLPYTPPGISPWELQRDKQKGRPRAPGPSDSDMRDSMISLRERVSNELLPFVRQPGQYIGGEVNQMVRAGDWEAADVRVAVAFPDTYAIGMSHLGCQIIYWLINRMPGFCAERVFSPWTDAEERMRARGLELFTWDTRQPVASADILAVSLQYELAFVNVLQLLDLAGMPLRAARRDDRHPLVLAGGPQADNPEPMAPFLDLVVIGDAEDALPALLESYRALKREGVRRRDIVLELAKQFDWVYAPSLYEVSYHDTGCIQAITPTRDDIAFPVRRTHAQDFEQAAVPVRPIVPHVEVVHDRMAVEIMRGCPQQCRFCHAGYTKKPLRWRSVDRILELAEEMHAATGMEELSLLSLSTADYPRLADLAARVNERFSPKKVNISVPSLRVDSMLRNIPWMVSAVRKSGLTVAVEVAPDDLRQAIGKRISDEDLISGVQAAFSAGWRSVKLYFMAGFPGEQPEDIAGIVDLCKRVSESRRELGQAPAAVTASVGWLVPKPYTPLQWSAQPRAEYFHDVRARLDGLARRSPVVVRTHSVERSVLEAVLARGDRRLADPLEHVYRAGNRFDSWDEQFNHARWQEAFAATGVDPDWYAHRERGRDEVLPWSHLKGRFPEAHLYKQYDRVLEIRPDGCSESACGDPGCGEAGCDQPGCEHPGCDGA